jgi:plasmid stability protein
MAKRPQVRLDDDVADLLQRVADRTDRSLSAEANHQLRQLLGGGRPTPAAAAAPSRVQAPSGIIGAGKGPSPSRRQAEVHRRARR